MSLERSLLRIAIAKDDEAKHLWSRWIDSVDFEKDLLGNETRLLGWLHPRLKQLGIQHPVMPRIQGFVRRTWVDQQHLLRIWEEYRKPFSAHNIPTILPIRLTPQHITLQTPDAPINILIPQEHYTQAFDLLLGKGWQFQEYQIPRTRLPFLGYARFWMEGKPILLLSWTLLPDRAWRAVDHDVWTCASDGVLCAEHQCLRLAVNMSSTLTIANFLTVLQSGINWDSLLTAALNRQVVLPLRKTLEQLKSELPEFSEYVPADIWERLKRLPVSTPERFLATRTKPHFLYLYQRYRLHVQHGDPIQSPFIIGYLRYIQYWHGLGRLLYVPRFILQSLFTRTHSRST